MNKINPSVILYYIAIISSFILVILVVILILIVVVNNTKFNKNAKLEHFEAAAATTAAIVSSRKEIKHNSNFYNVSDDIQLTSLGASNICIYNEKDMECITAEELAIYKKLPPIRKNKVCLDEECIGTDEIKVLNGNKKIKIKNDNGKYVGFNDVTAQTCTGIGFKIRTVGFSDTEQEFKLDADPDYSLYHVNKQLIESKQFKYDSQEPINLKPQHN